MIKAYRINFHSFIDVITNSSTEMYVSTDQKIVEFFRSLFTEEELEKEFNIMTFEQYIKDFDLERSDSRYEGVKDSDYILTISLEYGQSSTIERILEKLNFIAIYD
jgi:hypothetical protein